MHTNRTSMSQPHSHGTSEECSGHEVSCSLGRLHSTNTAVLKTKAQQSTHVQGSLFLQFSSRSFLKHARPALLGALICCFLLLLAACGPEQATSDRSEMAAETQRIAQEYASSQNLEQARTQLADLDVANVNQWLLYVTENSIAESADPNVVTSLIRLSNDMGLQSAAIVEYATQNNLLESLGLSAQAAVDSAASSVESGENAAEEAPVVNAAPVATPASEETTEESSESAQDAPAAEPTLRVIDIAPVNTPEPTATEAVVAPSLTASNGMNVRGGPGLTYNIVGAMQAGETADIIGKNPQGDWWQITLATGQQGWVYSPLVTTNGDVSAVAVAADIPTPPPAPTAAPEPVVEEPAPAEVAAEPAEPEAPAAEEAPPAPAGPDFVMVERRLWGAEENGGRMDGPSVVCGEKRQLVVHVLDAAGAPLNGVSVQVLYGNKEIEVTGAQGKGDGIAEFILGDGQDVTVIRDTDGRDVSSDVARNLTTKPYAIDFNDLIQAGYCTDADSCQKNVVDVYACGGHYSWTVKFQRSY